VEVFIVASTCQSPDVAGSIFFSPSDFSEKLKMTHNALRTPLRAKNALNVWVTKAGDPGLRKRMIDESEFRNVLVHFTVGEEWSREQGHKHILMPTLSDPNEENRRSDRKKKHLDALDIGAIRHAGTRFNALAKDVRKFAKEIALAPQSRPPQEQLVESNKRLPKTKNARAQRVRPKRIPRQPPPSRA